MLLGGLREQGMRYQMQPSKLQRCSALMMTMMKRRGMATRLGPPPEGQRYASVPKAQKRMKIYDLDEALVMYKRFRDIVKLRDLLEMSQGHVLNIHALGKLKGKFRLARDKRLCAYPELHPGVVQLTTDGDGWQWLEFTEEAESLIAEKAEYMRAVHEEMVVTWVRKLLMMSQKRSLSLGRLQFVKSTMFLPHDFKTRVVHSYPQYFRVVQGTGDKFLELMDWDDSLAVTYREKRLRENALELDELMGDTNPHAFPMTFPKGFHLRRKVREYYEEFQRIPFQSPYEVCRTTKGTMAAEKRIVGIVHELLSMYVEKRAQISQVSAFRGAFKLSANLRSLIERFQGIFYTSYKEDLFTVFLKEAYSGMRLIDRSPLLDFRDRFIQLCLVEPPGPDRVKVAGNRFHSDRIEKRMRDISLYEKSLGRIDERGNVHCKGFKETLVRCLSKGSDVEVLGEREEEGFSGLSSRKARFESSLEESFGYNIGELEKSLNDFNERPQCWPNEVYEEESDLEW